MSDLTITVCGEQLVLMPEHTVFWPRTRTLFLADLHFGKAAAFRALAVPIPEGNQTDDLARLSQAIERASARHVVLLGDVLHAKHGRADHVIEQVAAWRETHADRRFQMVRGNHDKRAGDPPDVWRMECVDEPLIEAPFALRHTPDESSDGYVLAGHVHPAVRLWGRGGLNAKLPCFVVGVRRMILPAFGSFIASAGIQRETDDRIIAVVEDELIEIE